MHCVLLGVVRQFVNLWFDSTSHDKLYSMRKKVAEIDKIIVSIKPPSEIKRLPRSLAVRRYWKASEWRSFLLFYSVVALSGIMPLQFYNHWLLLVFAVYHMLTKPVRRADLSACNMALLNFIALVPELYGPEHVSFNVHLLSHLVHSVEHWGPLWASSAFVFEDANGQLLKWFHGSNAVSRQIFKSYIASTHLRPLAERYVQASSSEKLKQFFAKLSGIHFHCQNATLFTEGVIGLGMCKTTSLSALEILAVESFLSRSDFPSTVATFKRVLVNGTVMHTLQYSQRIKRCDCFCYLRGRTGIYSLIKCFSFIDSKEMLFIFRCNAARQQRCLSSICGVNLLRHVFTARSNSSHLVACTASDIGQKCIALPNKKDLLTCIALPVFELD